MALQNQIKEIQADKEKERPEYEIEVQRLCEIKNRISEKEEVKRLEQKQRDEIQSEKQMVESRVSQLNRSAEQTEIRIAQYKRELIRFAPDIKKENEHLDCVIKEKKNKLNFLENGFRQFEELLIGLQRKLKETHQVFEAINNGMNDKEEVEREEEKKTREFEEELKTKGPKMAENEREIKLIENTLINLEGNLNKNDLCKQQ